MTNSIPAVEIKNLTVAYDANPVLWDVDLLIEQQVVMGLVGPNGAGKSTLLKSVLGLTPRLAGEICVMGQPFESCLLYTSPSPRDQRGSRMPSSA